MKLICAMCLLSVCAEAATQTAASTSYADVSTAYGLCSAGDVLEIPAGASTWGAGNHLDITLAITVKGAGTNATIIRSADEGFFTVSVASNTLCTVSNILFDGLNAANSWGCIQMAGLVRFSTCTFSNTAGWCIYAHDSRGLIDHCMFTNYHAAITVHNQLWGGANYGDGSWADAAYQGTTNSLYVEDCRFYGIGQVACIDGYGGARYVFRYNYVTNDIIVAHGTDSTGRPRSTRAIEVYGNVMTAPSSFANELRGGTCLVYSNIFTNFLTAALLKNFRESQAFAPWGQATGSNDYDQNAAADGYATIDQCGRGMGILMSNATPTPVSWPTQQVEMCYGWENTNNGTTRVNLSKGSYTTIVEGRDFTNNITLAGYSPLIYPHPLLGPDTRKAILTGNISLSGNVRIGQ